MKYFARFYQKLFTMDESKYLPPKFSYALKDLASYYGVFEKYTKRPQSTSSASSSLSFKQFQLNNMESIDFMGKESDTEVRSSRHSPDAVVQPSVMSKLAKKAEAPAPIKRMAASSTRESRGRSMKRPRKVADRPTSSIHNNNIIITINKSFNLGGGKRHIAVMEDIYAGPRSKRRVAPSSSIPVSCKARNGRVGLRYNTSQRATRRSKSPPEEATMLEKMQGGDVNLSVIKEGGKRRSAGSSGNSSRTQTRSRERKCTRGTGGYFQLRKFMSMARGGGGQW